MSSSLCCYRVLIKKGAVSPLVDYSPSCATPSMAFLRFAPFLYDTSQTPGSIGFICFADNLVLLGISLLTRSTANRKFANVSLNEPYRISARKTFNLRSKANAAYHRFAAILSVFLPLFSLSVFKKNKNNHHYDEPCD